jgi:RNA polymerase sigma factor (sigma-70 family)
VRANGIIWLGAIAQDTLPLTDDLSDAELLDQCRSGRQAAWSALVRRYQRLVYTVPRRAGLGADEAADVFQICFARLFEHLGRINDASKVRAWLVTTARRETLRKLEEIRRRTEVPALGAESDSGDEADPLARVAAADPLPEELLSDLQQQHRLRLAVDKLDPRSRQFVELLFLQDEPLPYHEIAAQLGIAEGSIGPTRARCLQKLRAILDTLP